MQKLPTHIPVLMSTLEHFRQNAATLLAVVDAGDAASYTQAGAYGIWSVKEVLAHLCGWMQEALRRYPRFAHGTGEIQYEVDAFNRLSVRLRRRMSYADVRQEFSTLVAALITAAQAVPAFNSEKDARYAELLTSLAQQCQAASAQITVFVALSKD